MRLNFVSVLVISLAVTCVAQADSKYTCTDSTVGASNQLIVKGTGTAATIHIDSLTMSGNLSYNDAYTQEAGQAGYDVFTGMVTDKLDTPPSQLEGAFLFQPALLTGGNGSMEQFGGDSFLVFNCLKTP